MKPQKSREVGFDPRRFDSVCDLNDQIRASRDSACCRGTRSSRNIEITSWVMMDERERSVMRVHRHPKWCVVARDRARITENVHSVAVPHCLHRVQALEWCTVARDRVRLRTARRLLGTLDPYPRPYSQLVHVPATCTCSCICICIRAASPQPTSSALSLAFAASCEPYAARC